MFQQLALPTFQERIGMTMQDLPQSWKRVKLVTSLRCLRDIEDVRSMPVDYLEQLLWHVRLFGNEEVRVYEGCSFSIARLDPNRVQVGQTFVERSKYQALIEGFHGIFQKFCMVEGVSGLGAYMVLGTDVSGVRSLAHYVPPIVEINGNPKGQLLDGLHRFFLARALGTTSESVVIENACQPFPCELRDWEDVSVVSAKPREDKRFFRLRRDMFRDVKYVGIDG